MADEARCEHGRLLTLVCPHCEPERFEANVTKLELLLSDRPPRRVCLAHVEVEPCQTCAAYIAGGL